MSIQTYIIIDQNQNKCVNTILWDGESSFNAGDNMTAQLSDGTIHIGDAVILTDGVYNFQSAPEPPSAVDLFDVNKFAEDLLDTFGDSITMFPYYAVIKDLTSFKNFSSLKTLVNTLLSQNIVDQDDVDAFNGVLMNQNIDLSTF